MVGVFGSREGQNSYHLNLGGSKGRKPERILSLFSYLLDEEFGKGRNLSEEGAQISYLLGERLRFSRSGRFVRRSAVRPCSAGRAIHTGPLRSQQRN